MIFTAVLVLIGSYFIGSISFGRILVRLLSPEGDIRAVTDKVKGDSPDDDAPDLPIGANTVSIAIGQRGSGMVAMLDILKGALPTLAVRLLFPGQSYYLIAAFGAMMGHIWPVYYRFAGGQGFSVLYGALFFVDWLSVPVTAVGGMLIGLFIVRNYLSMIFISILILIPWLWLRTSDPAHIAFAIGVNLLFDLAMLKPMIYHFRQPPEERRKTDEFLEQLPMWKGMRKIMDFFNIKPRVL